VNEFDIIRECFDKPVTDNSVVVGIGDDGAVCRPDADRELLCVIDTLVADVHFPGALSPEDLGYRAVAVNLSDVAAMGGRPRWMTLALSIVESDHGWISAFADGLFEAAHEFDVRLVGGDTTSARQVVVTVQIAGDVPQGRAILRSGACPGDSIFVTGTLGDARAGLALYDNGSVGNCSVDKCSVDNHSVGDRHARFLRQRFARPSARVGIGQALVGVASAAIDVSDGLAGDLSKLLQASGAGGRLQINDLPLSEALAAKHNDDAAREMALTGGDDYELCFTSSAELERIQCMADDFAVPITCIGMVTDAPTLDCFDGDVAVDVEIAGYRHFG